VTKRLRFVLPCLICILFVGGCGPPPLSKSTAEVKRLQAQLDSLHVTYDSLSMRLDSLILKLGDTLKVETTDRHDRHP